MTDQLTGGPAEKLQEFLSYLGSGLEAARDDSFDPKEFRAKLFQLIEGIYGADDMRARPIEGAVSSPRTMNAALRIAFASPSDGHSVARLETFLDFIAQRLAATDYAEAESLLHESVCAHTAARRAHERNSREQPSV